MADTPDNIARGLFAIAKSIDGLAKETGNVAIQLKWLGNGDAATTMGAIEFLSVSIKEAFDSLGDDQMRAAELIAEAMPSDASL